MSDKREERDLLGAWALDAVDDVERAAVERAVRRDPELAAEARQLRETVTRLADADAVTPPAGMRADVLSAVAATPQAASPPAGPIGRRRRWSGTSRWAAAAAVLLAAAVPGTLAVQQYERAQRAEEQVAAITAALAEPGAELLSADVTGGGRATAVVTDAGAVFAVRDLPALTDERDYQLWVIDDGGPASAGVLRVSDGLASAELADVPDGAVLAMTVEPAGGSRQPTTTPVVALPPV